jgi:mannose-6-phosphate isomerase-like protein (cupin superfamily)
MAKVGDVIENPLTGEQITFLQTAADTNGAVLQCKFVIQPGGFPFIAHLHPKQEERFKMLAGQLRIWLGTEERVISAGEELIVPAGTPHNWKNEGGREAQVLVEFRPALRVETLFETMFGLARDGKTDKLGKPNPMQMAVIAQAFSDEGLPVAPVDRFLFAVLLPILAPLGRLFGYKAVYARYTCLSIGRDPIGEFSMNQR